MIRAFVLATLTFLMYAGLSGCAQGLPKAGQEKPRITRDLQADLASLFPSDTVEVEIMDQVVMSPRRQELMAKYTAAIEKDPVWFLENQNPNDETGKTTEYDPRIGLTKTELEELQGMFDNMEDMKAVSSGTERVVVLRSDGVLRFRSQGRLEFLNSVTIDGRNNTASIAGYQLTALDTVCVNSADHVFKSSWRGYSWEFCNPRNVVAPTTVDELSKFSMTLYKVTVGLLEKSGRTILQVKGSEIHEGLNTVRYEFPLFF